MKNNRQYILMGILVVLALSFFARSAIVKIVGLACPQDPEPYRFTSTVIDVSTLGLTNMVSGILYGINNNRTSCGSVYDAGFTELRAIIRNSNGTIIDLAQYGVAGAAYAECVSINDNGDSVGYAPDLNFDNTHAILRKADGTIIDLAQYGIAGMTEGFVGSINKYGDICGTASNLARTDQHWIIRKFDGTISDLAYLGLAGTTIASCFAINNGGDTVGAAFFAATSDWHAVMRKADGTVLDFAQFSSGEQDAFLNDINSHGDAVGYTRDGFPATVGDAILRKADGTVINYGSFGISGKTVGNLQCINENGDAFGFATTAADNDRVGVMVRNTGQIINLGSFGYPIAVIYGCNGRNDFVGETASAGLATEYLLLGISLP